MWRSKCLNFFFIYIYLYNNLKEEVLKVLNELLEHENMQVRTFVNGTLYSLFSRASIREQAKVKEKLIFLKIFPRQ